jgi:hypothetical protein
LQLLGFSQTVPERGHKNSNVALRKAFSYKGNMAGRGCVTYFLISFHSFRVYASLERKGREMLFIYTIFPLFWCSSFPFICPETILTAVRTFTGDSEKKIMKRFFVKRRRECLQKII